jgi:hypothetical protein
MKLAEKYGELYDNEWTDALDSTEEMKALYPDMKAAEIEEVIIRQSIRPFIIIQLTILFCKFHWTIWIPEISNGWISLC